MELIERIIQLLGFNNHENSLGIYLVLLVATFGWLLTKSKEAAEWKGLFSKDKLDEFKKAKEYLKKEDEFYEEAISQEIFHRLMSIRCRKKNREIYQSLVIDGIASTEGIRQAYLFIDSKNSKVEIRLSLLDWIQVFFLAILLLFGTISIPFLLQDLLLNINPSTLLIRLRNLSVVTLFFFGSLKGLLPMVAAMGIKGRLKEFEKQNRECVPEQNNTFCEQSALPESSL
jgi:hypothetical protein